MINPPPGAELQAKVAYPEMRFKPTTLPKYLRDNLERIDHKIRKNQQRILRGDTRADLDYWVQQKKFINDVNKSMGDSTKRSHEFK